MRHLGRITLAATRARTQPPFPKQQPAPYQAFTTSGHPKPLPPAPPPSHPFRPSTHLFNKVAIVTGAGSRGSDNDLGNGSATAVLLAEAGAAVLCVDKHLSLAEHTASMITNHQSDNSNTNTTIPGQALAVEADVTNPFECSQIIDHALSTFGRLDILINVVGILGARGTAVDVDLAEWNSGMEVNVTSMMLMAKYAVPAMLRDKPASAEGQQEQGGQGIRGSIVNVGSVAGLRGGTAHLLYPTSKGAVVNMTRAMAAQHGREGVRVNCVCPGEFVFFCHWLLIHGAA